MYSYGSPHMAAQKQDDQLERTFSSYVRIQAVVLKTYLGRWTIGRSGARGSGISVLPARYDDDDDEFLINPYHCPCNYIGIGVSVALSQENLNFPLCLQLNASWFLSFNSSLRFLKLIILNFSSIHKLHLPLKLLNLGVGCFDFY